MSVKTCTKCGVKKPLSEFHKRAASIDGYKTQCKECLRAYSRAHNRKYYAENHDAVLEMQKDYRKRKKHETTTAPNRLGTPRHQPTQANHAVAMTMPHQIPLGEAYSHLKTIEGMLQTLYRYAPAQATTRKKIKDLAAQVKVCATEVDRYERRTRLVHPDHKH